MKVKGQAVLHASRERVWEALTDPAVLTRTIPGCEHLEATAPDHYRMTITAGVAAIRGTYLGEVALLDQQYPHSFVLRGSAAGSSGTVSTTVLVTLVETAENQTTLTYDADAVIAGVVAGVGQRMLADITRKMVGQFLAAVDAVLTGAGYAGTERSDHGPSGAKLSGAQLSGTQLSGDARPVAGGRAFARGFIQGAAFGALVALAGAVVGAVLGRRGHH